MHLISRLTAGLCLAAIAFAAGTACAADITVSAAASLTNAFKEAAHVFEKDHPGDKVLLNFAASDALVQQIAKGAPVDVFASADQEAMDKAEAQKLLLAGSRKNFASNSVVLIAPVGSTLNLKGMADLQQPAVTRVALGNPASVPIGRYARHAMRQARLWEAIEPKAIYSASVRQSLDYVARGEVDAGFVYATDVGAQKDKVKVIAKVPTDTPVTYPVAVIGAGAQVAEGRKFVDFLLTPAGQFILAKYGFGRP